FGAPNRQNVGPSLPESWVLGAQKQAAALAKRQGLGLVLPIEIPANYTDYATAYWAPTGSAMDPLAPPVICTPGALAASIPTGSPADRMCPDGTTAPCLFPVNVTNVGDSTTLNFNCLVANASPVKPPLSDNRVYNLMVRDFAGHYVLD